MLVQELWLQTEAGWCLDQAEDGNLRLLPHSSCGEPSVVRRRFVLWNDIGKALSPGGITLVEPVSAVSGSGPVHNSPSLNGY